MFLIISFLTLSPLAHAFEIPPNDGFVTDTVGVLSTAEDAELEQVLSDYRDETSNEIAILIVDTVGGEAIADVAVEVGRAWGVGTEENDNGILILVSYADRELFLATGYGLEGAVPDIVAKGIIEEDIVPQFRSGDYVQGLRAGIDALKAHIAGEYTAERYEDDTDFSGAWPFLLFFFFLGFEWLAAILGRTKSWWLGGIIGIVAGIILVVLFTWWISIPILAAIGFIFDFFVSRNYKKRGKTSWWAGGGWGPGGSSGGSSSGGFGGFSGGSFGGGGAGGSW